MRILSESNFELDIETLEAYFPSTLAIFNLELNQEDYAPILSEKRKVIKDICKMPGSTYSGPIDNLVLIYLYVHLSNNDTHTVLQKKERDYIDEQMKLSLFTNFIADYKDIEKIKIYSKEDSNPLVIKNDLIISEIYNAITPVLEKYENINIGRPNDKSTGYEKYRKRILKIFFNYIIQTSSFNKSEAIFFIDQFFNVTELFLYSTEDAIQKALRQ